VQVTKRQTLPSRPEVVAPFVRQRGRAPITSRDETRLTGWAWRGEWRARCDRRAARIARRGRRGDRSLTTSSRSSIEAYRLADGTWPSRLEEAVRRLLESAIDELVRELPGLRANPSPSALAPGSVERSRGQASEKGLGSSNGGRLRGYVEEALATIQERSSAS